MSTMDEKLEQHATSAGLARQTLKQLRVRWGSRIDAWTTPPTLVMVDCGTYHEIWRLVATHPTQPVKTMDQNTYELIEKKEKTP